MYTTELHQIVDLATYPLASDAFREQSQGALESSGSLVLPDFLLPDAVKTVLAEARLQENLAYYCVQEHNVYLSSPDSAFPSDHPRNQAVSSSKGCITDDQVSMESPLRVLYKSRDFRDFLCAVLGENSLYEYADPLSSINIHYASEGQELGWHFDNSSFAITLMIQDPEQGGVFEYIRGFRSAENQEMNFDGVGKLLRGECSPDVLAINAGSLVLFRGRDAIHRVTPVQGSRVRILAVLAYNSEPGVSLSEPARMTFYGRLS